MHKSRSFSRRRLAFLGLPILMVAFGVLGRASSALATDPPPPSITPSSVARTIADGQSENINKTVQTPTIPPLVDIFLLEDETGSFGDDIANLVAVAGPLWDAIAASGTNFTMGVGGFRDFAQDGWGSTGDWVYRRLSDLTTTKATFTGAVGSLTAGGGNDGPEAQLEALHYVAVPAHAAIDSNGDLDTTDANDTPTGLQPTWRVGATRIVLLATDASCHVQGDAGGWPGDAGTASAATTATALSAAGITLIGLTPGGAGTIACVDTLAANTGGSVQATTASGSAIKDAILAGLSAVQIKVSMTSDCSTATGGVVSTSFAVQNQVVNSGAVVNFVETISVSAGPADQGKTYQCDDWVLIDSGSGPVPMTDAAGNVIKEHKKIHVPDTTPPRAACIETTNPDGKTVPPAGSTTLPGPKGGQNEDCFYQLLGSDNVAVASIVVRDSASPFVSGAFASGDKVKVTQSPGATPSDNRPGPGVIVSHLKLKGEAILRVTDTSGNVTEVTCKLPPPPK